MSFISAWAVMKSKIESLEGRMAGNEKKIDDNNVSIERRNEEMRDVHRRLNKIDDLRIEANLAEIKTELSHIRKLIEGGRG